MAAHDDAVGGEVGPGARHGGLSVIRDIDPRLLRVFAAVAEELHFTRAAGRLCLAQQALSRDIRRLEREVGAGLFVRTTRRVTLTAEGERLLPYARRVLAAYEELNHAVAPADRPLTVGVAARAGTGRLVLDEARRRAPETEFVARCHAGLTGVTEAVAAGRLDVSFGRVAGLAPALRAGVLHRLVRYERVAVLLPEDHPLAALSQVPLGRLAGETVCAGAEDPGAAEWTDYARELFAGRGIEPAPPSPPGEGDEESARVAREFGRPVLAGEAFGGADGMVLRPLTDPVALVPVSVVWRRGLRHPGLDALLAAARELGSAAGWTRRPPGSWLPASDRATR